ncbi:DUF397 domain-containing protein [Streptomyces sp. MB09-02B]|uniref:DUF397 domain-containing protein n=1 Tax=Streptomyces sp. MB09-02B TaxID=3028667 RepID=UPI0029C0CE5F|nr:DUF397 domain-containing protein [Streptomyces sp. MB09-02B]
MFANAQGFPEPTWFKSSYSGANTTECVEAAFLSSQVLIRDSKRPAAACLSVSAEAWTSFLTKSAYLQASAGWLTRSECAPAAADQKSDGYGRRPGSPRAADRAVTDEA